MYLHHNQSNHSKIPVTIIIVVPVNGTSVKIESKSKQTLTIEIETFKGCISFLPLSLHT